MSTTATDYHLHSADFRSGRVSVDTPDHRTIRLTLGELSQAAHQSDQDLAAIYGSLYRRAVVEIDASRTESIHRCVGHRAIETHTTGFTGPVSRNENRAAHGNVCVTETCACGAQRSRNVNQLHVEEGTWA